MNSPPESPPRLVGLAVHRHSVVVTAIDREQQLLVKPRRILCAEFAVWSQAHLLPSDAVVLEATSNAWQLSDQLQPLVASVTVAHPTPVKTDARDALNLARLLAAGLIPAGWVPPRHVRELRALMSHRQRLIRQRTQVRNRLPSLLRRHNLVPLGPEPYGPAHQAWWSALELPASEHLRLRHEFALLDALEPLIAEADRELERQSTIFLVQLPGIGVLTAMVLLSAIGDIGRFPSARQLVGYVGLGARVHDSGQTHRTGGITKQGLGDLRGVLVEAAWVAVRTHPHWRAVSERLAHRKGSGKAIVAIARKLLVVVWHVLTERVVDRQAEVEAVARKFMTWGAQRGLARRTGCSRGAFVRQQLQRLGVGAELTVLRYGGERIQVPPPETEAGRLEARPPVLSG